MAIDALASRWAKAVGVDRKQFDMFFDKMLDGFAYHKIVVDKAGKPIDYVFLEVNRAFEKMTGLKRERILGKKVTEVLVGIDKDHADWIGVYGKVALTGDPVQFDNYSEALCKWFKVVTYCPEKGYFVTLFEDITERKKAEEALKDSEAKFKTLAENAPDAIMRFDRNLRVLYLNPQDLAATGKTLEDFLGKTNEEMGMPAELCKLWNDMFDRAKILKKMQAVEFDFNTPGGVKTFSLRVVPEFSGDGSLVSYLGISRDITERKKAEEALKKSESLYRTLFDNTEDGFVLVEPIFNEAGKSNDYVMLQVNRTWELQTGLRAVDFEGKRIRDVMPNVEPVWAASFATVANTGKSIHFESYNQVSNRWYDLYAFLYKEGQVGVLFRDITARKNMEKQLQDSERLAAIGATAGMVGHDIRNPLQAITGDLYLVKTELEDLSDNEQKKNALEGLDEIQKNIDYINKIVADLQDYARPLNPRAQETNIKSVIDEILLKNDFAENIKVTLEVEDKAERIRADPDYLKRVFSNLTLNAVQAMPNGGELTIRAYTDKQTNDAIITVKDTGVGIPEDVKPKLFTPMMTTKSKGQGFGLAVVKRLTEGLGGTVSFESEVGKGTKFILRFPPPQRAKR